MVKEKSNERGVKKNSEIRVSALRPVSLQELIGDIPAEDGGLRIGKSLLYPVLINRGKNKTGGAEVAAVLNHSLSSAHLLYFLNRAVPVKSYLDDRIARERQSEITGSDWAYMISRKTAGGSERRRLEFIHSPEFVSGFNEFRPHAKLFLAVLNDWDVNGYYELDKRQKRILPMIHLTINPNGSITWHDKVLSPELAVEIYRNSVGKMKEIFPTFGEGEFVADPFAGQLLFPYVNPSSTKRWKPVIKVEIPFGINGEVLKYEQVMRMAQMPVQTWQHKDEFKNSALMRGLKSHVLGHYNPLL